MSSPNPMTKKQRQQDILRAARAVSMGSTAWANERATIRTVISQNPKMFESVINLYGSDKVIDIVSSLVENGTLTSEPNVQIPFHTTQHLSGVRDRQHAALEQEAADSEAKDLDEAAQSDLAIHERDQGDERIDVAGYSSCLSMIVDSANVC